MEENNKTIREKLFDGVLNDIENVNPIHKSLSIQHDILKLNCAIGDSYKYVPQEELFKIVPVKLAMKISYTPTILSNIAFRYGDKAIEIAKKRKIYKLREFTKMYEVGKKGYIDFTISKCNSKVVDQLNSYIDNMLEENSFFMNVFYFTMSSNLLKMKYEIKDNDIKDMVIYMYMSLYIVKYIFNLEKEYEKTLVDLYNKYISKDQKYNMVFNKKVISDGLVKGGIDYSSYIIKCHNGFIKACRELGYPMPENEHMKICARTLHAESEKVINSIIKRFGIDDSMDDYETCKKMWDDLNS